MGLIRLSGKRDLRVDFFRGVALWWIYTDHIPGDLLSNLSLRNFAWCDATEIFVLLAGYGAGLSYGAKLRTSGYISTAADVLRRAWTLYIAHIFLFMLFTAQVTYSASMFSRVNYLQETRLDMLGDDPYRGILEALLLRFQPSLLNILPLYVVLLVLFAGTIWLLRWPRVLFGVSFAIYMLVRLTNLNLSAWTGDNWFFDPFAWQFLFTIGVLLACAPMRMPVRTKLFDTLAYLTLAIGFVVAQVVSNKQGWENAITASPFHWILGLDKTELHPLRLASIMAFTWLAVRTVRFDAAWLRTRWAAPFVLVGQNSLPVFCSGIVIGFVARLALEANYGSVMQICANLAGAAGMVGVGALVAWYRIKGKPKTHAQPHFQPESQSPLSAPGPGQVRRPVGAGAVLVPVNAQADAG